MGNKNMYAITEDEADALAHAGEEVYVVWEGGVPNFFNDIDGAYDFQDESGITSDVLDYTTGDYAS